MHYFCTYFDRQYLARGLALYASLRRHARGFTLFVLCLDEETKRTLDQLGLVGIRTVSLAELERSDAALLAAKSDRRAVEYYFTCTPVLMKYVLFTNPDVGLLTYLDADLFFFSSPDEALAELANASVGLVPQRFVIGGREEICGRYNVGWVSIRADREGAGALAWWRERCLESCSTTDADGSVYGDQKYLDELPTRYDRVVAIKHQGANVAPWNIGHSRIDRMAGQVTVNGQRLLWFHFSDFVIKGLWLHPHYGEHGNVPGRVLKHDVLAYYARVLRQIEQKVTAGGKTAAVKFERPDSLGARIVQLLKWRRAVFLPLVHHGGLTIEVELLLRECASRTHADQRATAETMTCP